MVYLQQIRKECDKQLLLGKRSRKVKVNYINYCVYIFYNKYRGVLFS